MRAACKRCKHSALCLPNQEEFLPQLFQLIARRTPANPVDDGGQSINEFADAFVRKLRDKLLKALPRGCPLLPPRYKDMVVVHWEFIGDELKVRLAYPTFHAGGGYSIGTRRV